MIHVGFTGTRQGLTDDQRLALGAMLRFQPHRITLHHGDCRGADAECHELARKAGVARIIIHPSTHALRAHCEGDEVMPILGPLERNHQIVRASDVMIACPSSLDEKAQPRSGTWATIRYTRRRGMALTIIGPDGMPYENS